MEARAVSLDPITWIPTTELAPTGKPWPRGFRNGNPGNFDWTAKDKWQGLADPPIEPPPRNGGRPRFLRTTAAHWGIRIIFRDLITGADRDGEVTIAQIIPEWAPPNENDTEAYIDQVCKETGFSRKQKLDLHSYDHAMPLAKALVRHENGNPRDFGLREWYPQEVWDRAATLAGLKRKAPKPVTQDRELVAGGTATVLAGVSAADGLGLVKQYVEPGSIAAQVVGVLAVVALVYLVLRRLRKRKVEAA